jgi:CRP-like cAMP-binding protein
MELLSALRSSPLFAGIDAPTLRRLLAAMSEERAAARRQLMGPADSAQHFRLIVSGRVKIVRSSPADGRELTLWLLGPGDGFDVVSLLDGRAHAVSAWSLTPVHILTAPLATWSGWLRWLRPLDLAAHRYCAGKLRELADLASDLALCDTPTRLAHLLLRHFGAGEGNLLLDLPQRELAAMIGSVRVVVSRALAQLRAQGAVELHDGSLRAVDLERLLARAERDAGSPPLQQAASERRR